MQTKTRNKQQTSQLKLRKTKLQKKKITNELHNNHVDMHTHQMRRERGYRVVIKNLHPTTEREWIHEQLTGMGYTPRYIRVIKHRFSGKPMNLFAVELQPTHNGTNEESLKLERMGSQCVAVELMRKSIDPVQCFRCQAFGHTKNYCRRPFACLKCAQPHPTSECVKAGNTPAKCVNCHGAHIASYKGCRVLKAEQEKMSINKARYEVANILMHNVSDTQK